MTLGTGSSIPAGKVRATLKRGGLTLEDTFADAEGKFAFTQLTEGDYEVIIEAPDYRSYTHRVGLRYPGHEEENFSVRLVPLESALETASTAALITPEAAELYEQGLHASQAGQHEKAAEFYAEAVSLAPGYVEAWNNLGNEYRMLKRWQKAEQALGRALALEPQSALVRLNLGMLYLGQGKMERARHSLEAAINKDPRQATAHFLLGMIAYQRQEMDPAAREFRRALELDPQAAPQAKVYLASILAWQGRFSEAVRELEEFLQDHPRHPQASTAEQLLERIHSTAGETSER